MHKETRSQAKASGSKERGEIPELEKFQDVDDNLVQARKGVTRLLEQYENIRGHNEELSNELKELKGAKASRSSKSALENQVRELKSEIRRLEKARIKDQEKIEELKDNEVKREAAELEELADRDARDTTHEMRKMLRRFGKLMELNTVDEEQCPICLETMTVKTCSSLTCQHIVCNVCLPRICRIDWKDMDEDEGEPGREVTKCPQCRQVTPRKEVEIVQYTSTERWDELLEVGNSWAKIDSRRADDTSEEEDQQLYDSSTETSSSRPAGTVDDESGSDETSAAPEIRTTTPEKTPAVAGQSYSASSSPVKRKLLQELADKRSKKKRR